MLTACSCGNTWRNQSIYNIGNFTSFENCTNKMVHPCISQGLPIGMYGSIVALWYYLVLFFLTLTRFLRRVATKVDEEQGLLRNRKRSNLQTLCRKEGTRTSCYIIVIIWFSITPSYGTTRPGEDESREQECCGSGQTRTTMHRCLQPQQSRKTIK